MPRWHNADMDKDDYRPRHYLREWREFRRLTGEQLADKIGTDKTVISLLENGKRRLSDKWLLKLAPALNTSPGFILDHDPNNLPTAILDVWADIPEERRTQALQVLETFRRRA